MAQTAKFIDITRTYLPINPNRFPPTQHGTSKEDFPEERVPVMAYEGRNFLPTAYGYKSYFGTTGKVEIDALAAKPDFVFVYQNTNFENILIALCDTGIWTKRASTTGAWVNSVPMTASTDPTLHFDWTFVVISQVLYVYRQNNPSFQKIVPDLTLGIIITSVVPNTLNMEGQMGIFRAGGRLGFWDSADSTSWSNQDDYSDFAPNILTLASTSKFIDINGRIVTIKGHGPGFIIYCTKSIIYIAPAVDSTFQWVPKVIFSNNGIVYPRMVVEDSPDTTHFAYTDTGIYRIEATKEENILTDFSDFLKAAQDPIYLNLIQGRYLFFEILDPEFLDAIAQFTTGQVEEITYNFPGVEQTLQEAVEDELLTGTNLCQTIHNVGEGLFDLPEEPEDKKDNTSFRARWTAYLSRHNIVDPDFPWTNVPVATIDPNAVEKNHSPDTGIANLVSSNTTDSTNKTTVEDTDAYIDGIWTMERFVAAQNAIWDIEEEALAAFITRLTSRTSSGSKTTNYLSDPALPATIIDRDHINTYVSQYSGRQFGFSKCEFWLTRYCIGAMELYRVQKNTFEKVYHTPVETMSLWRFHGHDWGATDSLYIYNTPQEALDAAYAEYVLVWGPSSRDPYEVDPSSVVNTPLGNPFSYANISNGGTLSVVAERTILSTSVPNWDIIETMNAYNEGVDVELAPTPDTGYCTLNGYDYTRDNDTIGHISVPSCSAEPEYPPDSEIRIAPLVYGDIDIAGDGSFCSIPFTPVTIPGTPDVVISWPSTSVTLPASSFLLQTGSIAPVYPTMHGAFVYDLKLKKWGLYKGLYKCLVNYSPINNALNGVIPYNVFSVLGGIFDIAGFIRLFDAYPEDSYMTYGKLGFYRQGKTSVEEVKFQFASISTGQITVDSSIEGRFTDPMLAVSQSFENVMEANLTGGYDGNWHNITIRGTYDISYIEYRAQPKGSR